MLAIVLREDNTTYVTPVFAIKAKGWNSEAIVFDESGKYVKKIEVWKPRRQVFIVEWTRFPCKRGSWEGYAKIVNDKAFMKNLCFGKSVPIGDDERFSGFSVKNSLPDWFEIKDDADIESLMEVSFDFHDSEILSCDRRGDLIEMRFDTTWGCFITVRFEGVVQEKGIDNLGMILDSKLQFENGMLGWQVVDGASGSVGGIVDWNTPFEGASVVCEKIYWKIEIDPTEED